MFRQLASELMKLVRIQFIVSVVLYQLCVIFLPGMGFSGLVMQIYPCLAAGYFILFLLYAELIFLYYFNDMTGALLTAVHPAKPEISDGKAKETSHDKSCTIPDIRKLF